MSSPPAGPVAAVRHVAQTGAALAAPALERLARLGYAGQGAQYFTIGILALFSAAHRPDGSTTDRLGAVQIDRLPLASFLILSPGAGLTGRARWQVNGLVKRAGYLLSAFSSCP